MNKNFLRKTPRKGKLVPSAAPKIIGQIKTHNVIAKSTTIDGYCITVANNTASCDDFVNLKFLTRFLRFNLRLKERTQPTLDQLPQDLVSRYHRDLQTIAVVSMGPSAASIYRLFDTRVVFLHPRLGDRYPWKRAPPLRVVVTYHSDYNGALVRLPENWEDYLQGYGQQLESGVYSTYHSSNLEDPASFVPTKPDDPARYVSMQLAAGWPRTKQLLRGLRAAVHRELNGTMEIFIADNKKPSLEMFVMMALLADTEQEFVRPDLTGLQIFPLGSPMTLSSCSFPELPEQRSSDSGATWLLFGPEPEKLWDLREAVPAGYEHEVKKFEISRGCYGLMDDDELQHEIRGYLWELAKWLGLDREQIEAHWGHMGDNRDLTVFGSLRAGSKADQAEDFQLQEQYWGDLIDFYNLHPDVRLEKLNMDNLMLLQLVMTAKGDLTVPADQYAQALRSPAAATRIVPRTYAELGSRMAALVVDNVLLPLTPWGNAAWVPVLRGQTVSSDDSEALDAEQMYTVPPGFNLEGLEQALKDLESQARIRLAVAAERSSKQQGDQETVWVESVPAFLGVDDTEVDVADQPFPEAAAAAPVDQQPQPVHPNPEVVAAAGQQPHPVQANPEAVAAAAGQQQKEEWEEDLDAQLEEQQDETSWPPSYLPRTAGMSTQTAAPAMQQQHASDPAAQVPVSNRRIFKCPDVPVPEIAADLWQLLEAAATAASASLGQEQQQQVPPLQSIQQQLGPAVAGQQQQQQQQHEAHLQQLDAAAAVMGQQQQHKAGLQRLATAGAVTRQQQQHESDLQQQLPEPDQHQHRAVPVLQLNQQETDEKLQGESDKLPVSMSNVAAAVAAAPVTDQQQQEPEPDRSGAAAPPVPQQKQQEAGANQQAESNKQPLLMSHSSSAAAAPGSQHVSQNVSREQMVVPDPHAIAPASQVRTDQESSGPREIRWAGMSPGSLRAEATALEQHWQRGLHQDIPQGILSKGTTGTAAAAAEQQCARSAAGRAMLGSSGETATRGAAVGTTAVAGSSAAAGYLRHDSSSSSSSSPILYCSQEVRDVVECIVLEGLRLGKLTSDDFSSIFKYITSKFVADPRVIAIEIPSEQGSTTAAGTSIPNIRVADAVVCWLEYVQQYDFRIPKGSSSSRTGSESSSEGLWAGFLNTLAAANGGLPGANRIDFARAIMGNPTPMFQQMYQLCLWKQRYWVAGTVHTHSLSGASSLVQNIVAALDQQSIELKLPHMRVRLLVPCSGDKLRFKFVEGRPALAKGQVRIVLPLGQDQVIDLEDNQAWQAVPMARMNFQPFSLKADFNRQVTPAAPFVRVQVTATIDEKGPLSAAQVEVVKQQLTEKLLPQLNVAAACMLRFMLPWQLPTGVAAALLREGSSMYPLARLRLDYSGKWQVVKKTGVTTGTGNLVI